MTRSSRDVDAPAVGGRGFTLDARRAELDQVPLDYAVART